MEIKNRLADNFRKGLTGILAGAMMSLGSLSYAEGQEKETQAQEEYQRKVEIVRYNASYALSDIETRADKIPIDPEARIKYIKDNTVSLEQMCEELADSRAVIFDDVEFSLKQKAQVSNLIGKIAKIKGRENVYVGLELFYADQNKELNDFMTGKTDLPQLYSTLGYGRIMDLYGNFGYDDMLKFLKENKIKTIGINKPLDKKIWNFIKKMEEAKVNPPYEIPQGFTEEEIMGFGLDFYNRDVFTSQIAKVILKDPKSNFICLIGAMHGYENHLPKIMNEVTGVKPKVVEWNLRSLDFKGDRLDFNKTEHENLKVLGLTEDNALRIGDGFLINLEWDWQNADKYFEKLNGLGKR